MFFFIMGKRLFYFIRIVKYSFKRKFFPIFICNFVMPFGGGGSCYVAMGRISDKTRRSHFFIIQELTECISVVRCRVLVKAMW